MYFMTCSNTESDQGIADWRKIDHTGFYKLPEKIKTTPPALQLGQENNVTCLRPK
jgi:hypothetical protein